MWPVQPALVARIEAAIRTFRAADPFLPIHVIVSNHVLATLLGRSLFTDTGYLAIDVQLPHEFAWSVTAMTTSKARPERMTPFLVLWTGQALSIFGSMAVQFA